MSYQVNEKALENLTKLSEKAFNWTSFNPEKRGKSFVETVKTSLKYYNNYLGDLFNEAKIISLYEDILAAQSRCASAAVTGPANFPTEKNEQKYDRLRNKYKILEAYIEKMHSLKVKKLNKDKIEAGGGIYKVTSDRILELEKLQLTMKAANKILRSVPRNIMNQEKLDRLKKLSDSFTINFEGFESFELTLNNDKIKRAKQKLSGLEKKAAATSRSWNIVQNEIDVEITLDYDIDRIIIRHSQKPSKEVIAGLKKLGMRWSPKSQGWQRQITNNALWALTGTDYEEGNNG